MKILIVFAGFLLALQVNAQVLPLDPAVRTVRLANGFTYYIQHNTEPKNRVVFYLANKVGSILETNEQLGLAHFMEHMSFNGTKHFPKSELINYLQKSGVRFGADLNAYTSFDETVYQLPLPADDPAIVKNGLQIMRDWAQEATLDPSEIDKERGVVLEEKRLGQGAQERLRRQYFPVLLNQSRYAERMPIGTEKVLSTFKPAVIKAYYRDWYRPNLQALVVVGDIDVVQMEKAIKAKFADLKNPVTEKKRVKYVVSLTGKNQFIAVTDKEMTVTVMELLTKHKAPKLKTEADYRGAVKTRLFNSMMAQRFSELSQQADPPFLEGGCSISPFMGGLDTYDLQVVAKPGQLERGFKAVYRESERLRRFGFTQTELERAKQAYASQMEAGYQERDKTPSENLVKEYVQHFLNQTAAPGVIAEKKLVDRFLPSISLADLNLLTKAYIKNFDRDILLMAPEREKANLPAQAKVQAWIKAVIAEALKPYKDNVGQGNLLNAEPVAGTIISEVKDAVSGVTTLTLSNGVKVVLKQTSFKDNEVLFSAYAPGGSSLYTNGDFQSASNAAGLIANFGAGNYSLSQLEKWLSGKQVQVQPYISEHTQGFKGSAVPKDLETALQLVYAQFTAPRMDSAIFKGIIANAKAGIANRGDDPNSVFQDTVSAVLGMHNIRRTGPTQAKLDEINLDRSYGIYKERFADAAGFTFTFVGSFNSEKLKPMLLKYLGSLPATHLNELAKDLEIHIPVGKQNINVLKGSENKATVRLVFSGPFDYSAQQATQLDALKETLEFRLLERLREDESGVYAPSAQTAAIKLPTGRYSFHIVFGCAPANVNKLIASTLDEIEKLKKDGPPQTNIDKYKAEEKRQDELQLRDNKWWLGYLDTQLQNGDSLDQFSQQNSILEQVNIESVRAAANRYLGGENYIRFVLLPENSK